MMVNTIHGEMDDSLLEKKTGVIDNQGEYTTWIEYYFNNELVHRSVHVTVKQGLSSEGVAASIGGG